MHVQLLPKCPACWSSHCTWALYLCPLSIRPLSLNLAEFCFVFLPTSPQHLQAVRKWKRLLFHTQARGLDRDDGEGKGRGLTAYVILLVDWHWFFLSVIVILEVPSLFQRQSNCWEQINYVSSQCVWLRGTWREGFSLVFLATKLLNGCFPDWRVRALGSCRHLGLSVWWQACSLAGRVTSCQ